MSKNAITAIVVSTNAHIHKNGSPYPESVSFFRKHGYATGFGCSSYRVYPTHDSFYRVIRAMCTLAVRKYQTEFDKVTL
jgi:hypothetical protein